MIALALPLLLAASPVKVRLVEAGASATPGRQVAATVAAVERAVVSTRVAAAVARVHVSEGRRVRRGDLLVSLADEDLRGALAAAEAGRDAALAHERRTASLLALGAATPAEHEQARAQRARADAALAAARANLGYAALRAPFDGVVQARRVSAGDLVGPGQPLVELEGDALELQATLSEEEARGLAPGQALAFEADGARGTAVVTALATGGDPVAHRALLRAKVREGAPRAGAFARLALPRAAPGSPSVWVPRSAVVRRGDLQGVFVADGGSARLRWLALGEPAGALYPVRAGLAAGERVIDAPGSLRDGAAIEAAEASDVR